ncbi:MAG: tRNA threonylcarbamoyladenosine dehydratase [Clostridia bacterium]|nr:tRNA threonylcarbamoyladenosine dehydratase [Clostridia bacterium]
MADISRPIYDRTKRLYGEEKTARLAEARVLLFGLGGVGGYVLEALCRAGVARIGIVDCDTVNETNLNRQILATLDTVGMHKCDAAIARAKAINPETEIVPFYTFVTAENAAEIIDSFGECDYVADCIDNVSAKTALIKASVERNIPIISSMGTGNKVDPTKLRISDIFKTDTCPLARAMRLSLKKAGVKKCPVLWSTEQPMGATVNENGRNVPGSASAVPAAAGLFIAAHIMNGITNL